MDELIIGIICAVTGMCLFNLGIALDLPHWVNNWGECGIKFRFNSTLAKRRICRTSIPIFYHWKMLSDFIWFLLGYGATLAELALNALGSTVEKITVGAFKKNLLMQAVATGVALGIATGVAKIAFNLELWYLLIPPYCLLLILTFISSEDFVNFGWDSAGVTTGPITVPLVLAIDLEVEQKQITIGGFRFFHSLPSVNYHSTDRRSTG